MIKKIYSFLKMLVKNSTPKPTCKYCGCVLEKDDEETCFKNPNKTTK